MRNKLQNTITDAQAAPAGIIPACPVEGLDMKTQWIGPDESLKVGDVGFLINFYNENTSAERYELRDTPAYTNQSHEPRLHGWCGSYNNLSTGAYGMAKVIRLARNGRALVQELEGDELIAALDEFGYPDLAP